MVPGNCFVQYECIWLQFLYYEQSGATTKVARSRSPCIGLTNHTMVSLTGRRRLLAMTEFRLMMHRLSLLDVRMKRDALT